MEHQNAQPGPWQGKAIDVPVEACGRDESAHRQAAAGFLGTVACVTTPMLLNLLGFCLPSQLLAMPPPCARGGTQIALKVCTRRIGPDLEATK